MYRGLYIGKAPKSQPELIGVLDGESVKGMEISCRTHLIKPVSLHKMATCNIATHPDVLRVEFADMHEICRRWFPRLGKVRRVSAVVVLHRLPCCSCHNSRVRVYVCVNHLSLDTGNFITIGNG